MATTFPTLIDSYTTKTNNVDTIAASHVNDLQDAMVAVETLLDTGGVPRTSWTPTLTFDTTGPTSITYVTANTGGFYSRINGIVFVTGRLEISAISGGSTNVNISLPVAARSGNFTLSSITINTATNWTTLFPAVGRVIPGSSAMRLYSYAAGTGHTVITNSHVSATSGLLFTGFYYA